MTFFSAATGTGSETLKLMPAVVVLKAGYLALNSSTSWRAPKVWSVDKPLDFVVHRGSSRT